MQEHSTQSMPARIRRAIAGIRRECGPNVKIYVFGSRASASARPSSDWDIALEASEPIAWTTLATVKQNASDVAWPYKIDIVDMSRAPVTIRQSIERTRVELDGIE